LIPSPSFFKNKKLLILTHAGSDLDAIASAGAIYFSLNKKPVIGAIDHINQQAKSFAKKLSIPYSVNPSLKGFDAILAVDFNSIDLAGSLKEKLLLQKEKIFVIDHHSKGKKTIAFAKNSWIERSASSASELVFEWLKKNHALIPKKSALCIAAGILTDSNNFITAKAKTFGVMQTCLQTSGTNFSDITSLVKEREDTGEKIAKLKAAKRAKIYCLGKYIIVSTDIGAFGAEAAETLIQEGADVVFAGDLEKGSLQLSGRASPEILKETSLDLSEHIFQPLGNYFKGSGGGHAGAAGFNGFADSLEQVFQRALQLLESFLKKKNPSIKLKEYD